MSAGAGGPRVRTHHHGVLLRLFQPARRCGSSLASRSLSVPRCLVAPRPTRRNSLHPRVRSIFPSSVPPPGSIEGFYHDPRSSPYQRLELRCERAGGASTQIAFVFENRKRMRDDAPRRVCDWAHSSIDGSARKGLALTAAALLPPRDPFFLPYRAGWLTRAGLGGPSRSTSSAEWASRTHAAV